MKHVWSIKCDSKVLKSFFNFSFFIHYYRTAKGGAGEQLSRSGSGVTNKAPGGGIPSNERPDLPSLDVS